MFAPGLFGTGDLVNLFGADFVAGLGIALFALVSFATYVFVPEGSSGISGTTTSSSCVSTAGSTNTTADQIPYWAFLYLLIVLGLAWHLVFVAGSGLLENEPAKIQGAAESVAFAAVAIRASCSGFILTEVGWAGLNLFCAPITAAMGAYLLYEGWVNRLQKMSLRVV